MQEQQAVEMFATTQCSWCRKFYTTPFLCPYDRLQSNCLSFDGLSAQERGRQVEDEKLWRRMADMLSQVEARGMMSRCREEDCLALNPNPQATSCWRCQRHSLSCPECDTILRYSIERDMWKCPNAAHSGTFFVVPTKPQEEWTARDLEQWMEEFRKREERKQKEREEQEKRTQAELAEREREKERKEREEEEEEQESYTQAELARQAREEFRIKRRKEQEERRHGQQTKGKKAAESNLYFEDGYVDDNGEWQRKHPIQSNPEHPGYHKVEWRKRQWNIIERFSRMLMWPFETLGSFSRMLTGLFESLDMLRWPIIMALFVGIAYGGVYLWTEHQNPTGVEQGIFEQINVEREKVGLNPITWDESMHMGAREHSELMAQEGNLFHAAGDFSECVYSSTSSVMGVNFPGYPDAKITVKAWMDSPGHRSILLGNEYTVGAVGVSKKGYATYRCR